MPWTSTTTRSSGFTVTAAVWNAELVDNMTFLEQVYYGEVTSTASVTGTSFVTIASAGAITYEAVPHLFEFWAFRVTAGGSGSFSIHLRDTTTDLGQYMSLSTSGVENQMYLARQFTPSAASHNYNWAGINGASQTSTVTAGAGGAGVVVPAWMRISRVPT